MHARCTNDIRIVVRLTLALERTSKSGIRRVKKERVHYLGQNAAVSCRNYRRSIKCCTARLAEEEEEERRKSKFQLMFTCTSRKLCVNVIPVFDHKTIR